MAHLGQSAHCAGSARRPRKAIEISTVNLHYWLPISLLLWKPIIGHCRITEQFMEVFRVYKPQWELPLTGVFRQPRSAYLFTQWVKSIRNLNKSLLKYHQDSHSKSASNSFQLHGLSSHPSSWLHSVNRWTTLSLFHFIFCRNVLALTLRSTAPLRT